MGSSYQFVKKILQALFALKSPLHSRLVNSSNSYHVIHYAMNLIGICFAIADTYHRKCSICQCLFVRQTHTKVNLTYIDLSYHHFKDIRK